MDKMTNGWTVGQKWKYKTTQTGIKLVDAYLKKGSQTFVQ